MRVQQGRVRNRVRGRRRLEENRARVARSPRVRVRGRQVSTPAWRTAANRGSGKLVLVDDALHFWLRCSDVYFSVALRDCVKVELKDAWGGVRVQATGKERDRTAILVVTFKSEGGNR